MSLLIWLLLNYLAAVLTQRRRVAANFVVIPMQFVVETPRKAAAMPGWYAAQTRVVGKMSLVVEIFVAFLAQYAVLTHVSYYASYY